MNPCVYCGAAWPNPSVDIVHLPICGTLTNLYPVRDADLQPQGFGCTECGHQFRMGETYTTIPIVGANDIVRIVCLDCAARLMTQDPVA